MNTANKRIKRVFRNHQEVCHVWASRSQEEGQANNINFSGDIIYSYGWWPMAKFVDESVVLINCGSYSVSTSRHQNYVSQAIPNEYLRLYVPDLSPNHEKNLDYFYDELRSAADKFWASNTQKQWFFDFYQDQFSQLKNYAEYYKLKLKPLAGLELSGPKAKKQLAEVVEKIRVAEENRHRKISELKAEHQSELDQLELDWIAGKTDKKSIRIPYGFHSLSLDFGEIRLRYNKERDEVQTSLGAYVPAREAHLLYKAIKSKKPVHGHKIGHYTVIGYNGTLKIGCHEITSNEIERFAKIMNW